MTKLDTLVERWDVQHWAAIKHLPCDTIHQRKAYWKAHKRINRRIRGRAARVAHHLINLEWCARVLAEDPDYRCGDGYDETYAITV